MTRRAILGCIAAMALTPAAAHAFTLRSSAFLDGKPIPARFTCEGSDISPPLQWQAAPNNTQSFALVVDDPDAPDPAAPRATAWVHWVLYNLPADTIELPEGVKPDQLPLGTRQGVSDGSHPGYHGPCPPVGRHRYIFHLYALDAALPAMGMASKARVEQAMVGHIVATAELVGTYQKAGTPKPQ